MSDLSATYIPGPDASYFTGLDTQHADTHTPDRMSPQWSHFFLNNGVSTKAAPTSEAVSHWYKEGPPSLHIVNAMTDRSLLSDSHGDMASASNDYSDYPGEAPPPYGATETPRQYGSTVYGSTFYSQSAPDLSSHADTWANVKHGYLDRSTASPASVYGNAAFASSAPQLDRLPARPAAKSTVRSAWDGFKAFGGRVKNRVKSMTRSRQTDSYLDDGACYRNSQAASSAYSLGETRTAADDKLAFASDGDAPPRPDCSQDYAFAVSLATDGLLDSLKGVDLSSVGGPPATTSRGAGRSNNPYKQSAGWYEQPPTNQSTGTDVGAAWWTNTAAGAARTGLPYSRASLVAAY